ncbi:hypothetical protein ABPG72_009186 [Tetrahymena utriculariae]
MTETSDNILLDDEIKWGIIIGTKYYKQTYGQLIQTFNLKSKGTISKILQKYQIQNNVNNNFNMFGQNGHKNSDIEPVLKYIVRLIRMQAQCVRIYNRIKQIIMERKKQVNRLCLAL